MVLELLDRFHLGDIVHLSVGYAILETSLHVFVGFSGLIEMGSADLERVLWKLGESCSEVASRSHSSIAAATSSCEIRRG